MLEVSGGRLGRMLVEVLELVVLLWVVEVGAALVEVALELLEVPAVLDGAGVLDVWLLELVVEALELPPAG